MATEPLVIPARALAAAWCAYRTETGQQEAGAPSARQQIEAQIAQQMLFEKWLKQDEWLLRAEALPLLHAASPETWAEFLQTEEYANLEQALWDAILTQWQDRGSPVIENPQDSHAQWRITTRNFYGWARMQQLDVPSAMDNLMSFILSSVQMDRPAEPAPGPTAADMDERVCVLGAALSLLTAVPEQCRQEDGWISGEKMAAQIIAKAAILFPQQTLSMGQQEMANLIEHWSGLLENQEQSPF